MYALVEFKGKQYRAETGGILKVDKIDAEPGTAVDIDSVLLLSGDTVTVGNPYVPGAKVSATLESHGKDKKSSFSSTNPKRTTAAKRATDSSFRFLRLGRFPVKP